MKHLTFAKVMIALCLIGSGVLAWYDWQQYREIQRLEDALRPNGPVELHVREIQRLGKQYAELHETLRGDELIGQESPLFYIQSIADRDKIGIGDVDIRTNERESRRTTVDKIYQITPTNRDRDYAKLSIANFLYTLEEKSPRIRVTKLSIDQLDQEKRNRPRPTEYPSDRYQFSAEVTSRERLE